MVERELYNLVEWFQWTEQAQIEAAVGPQSVPSRDMIFIPMGQKLDFHLKIPANHVLTLDRLSSRGEPSPSVVISLSRPGGSEEIVGQLGATPEAQRFRIPDPVGSEICRLSFAASDYQPSSNGGILLWGPRILYVGEESGLEVAQPEIPPSEGSERPNIIYYLVDTQRRENLGAYGYNRDLSPRIDAFANQATVFERAVAQSPWTRASIASVFTGLEPHLHGVNDRDDSLSEEALTLAEYLSAGGYQTTAFITNGNGGEKYGLAQGFDSFSSSRNLQNDSDKLNDRTFQFLNSEDLKQPFFLWIHSMDPHAPYTPPEPFRSAFAAKGTPPDLGKLEVLKDLNRKLSYTDPVADQIRSLYDAEVAFNDDSFGRLLDELKRLDLFDDSLIAYVSDHGEEFWEHGGWSHGKTLYGEVLDIPLIVKGPRQTVARRVPQLAQHVDLFATAVDYAGLQPLAYSRSRSLQRVIESGNGGLDQTIYSVLDLDGRKAVSVTDTHWKLIVPRRKGGGNRTPRLFKRSEDPGERVEAVAPIVHGYLMTLLRWHERPAEISLESEATVFDEEMLRELKALGYIN